jgi:AraC-like DNA-binding protein
MAAFTRSGARKASEIVMVTEIGFDVGFSETSSFTAAFRKYTGDTDQLSPQPRMIAAEVCPYEAQRSPLAFRAEDKNSNLIAA